MAKLCRVYKYHCFIDDIVEVELPAASKTLRFEFQNGQLFLWALVDPTSEPKTFRFRMAGTGHDIVEDSLTYVNTVFVETLVFHFFQL